MVIVFFIYVLEGNLQLNCWICKMVDYLNGSIVKTLVCLEWGNLTIVNHLYFQNIILSKHFH